MSNKKFYFSIAVIVFVFVVLMFTSLLLELQFVQLRIVRQIIVYLIMAVELFAGYRAILLINSESK